MKNITKLKKDIKALSQHKDQYYDGSRIIADVMTGPEKEQMIKENKIVCKVPVESSTIVHLNSIIIELLAGLLLLALLDHGVTPDGCPLQPGSSLQKVLHLTPSIDQNRDKRGIALDGQLKRSDTTLASTTLLLDPEQRDAFGIVVSYSAKVKLYLGALSGELVAELPFILMHPKEGRAKVIHADSQADVEMFRQDTVHHQESVEVY
ncbi:hypothetical protein evm_014928 [Chilo suppressalis]|nr:hypothetical protein evm_014928 [Chilo suppressalis]